MGTAVGLDGQCFCARGTTITEQSDYIALIDSFLPGDAGIEKVDGADRQRYIRHHAQAQTRRTGSISRIGLVLWWLVGRGSAGQ
jgi:hypothetical protein